MRTNHVMSELILLRTLILTKSASEPLTPTRGIDTVVAIKMVLELRQSTQFGIANEALEKSVW